MKCLINGKVCGRDWLAPNADCDVEPWTECKVEMYKQLQSALKEQSNTLVYCQAVTCKHNDTDKCVAETIHLQGCTPDADNIFGCSEFKEG